MKTLTTYMSEMYKTVHEKTAPEDRQQRHASTTRSRRTKNRHLAPRSAGQVPVPTTHRIIDKAWRNTVIRLRISFFKPWGRLGRRLGTVFDEVARSRLTKARSNRHLSNVNHPCTSFPFLLHCYSLVFFLTAHLAPTCRAVANSPDALPLGHLCTF